MKESKTTTFRNYLPITVPLGVGLTFTFIIAVLGNSALRNGQCNVGLPWTAESASKLVALSYPAAWYEAASLSRVSTPCIAQLHIELISGYTAVFILSLFAGLCALPFTNYISIDTVLKDYESKKINIIAHVLGSITFLYIFIISLNTLSLIRFDQARRRFAVDFDGIYTDVFSYWMLNEALFFMGYLSFWIGVVGLANARRFYLNYKENRGNKVTPEQQAAEN